MTWKPISEVAIWQLINEAEARMTVQQTRLWDAIKIMPEKWAQHRFGDLGGGFWAVAVLGRTVVWYNDIEDGFNHSHCSSYGTIDDYWCNQDELEVTVQAILNMINTGYDIGGSAGPPQPVR